MSHVLDWAQFLKLEVEKKNTVQALKYPSAHAVTLYMPGFKAIN